MYVVLILQELCYRSGFEQRERPSCSIIDARDLFDGVSAGVGGKAALYLQTV